ncbi:MAG: protein translocase subunit SecF, partial [Acetobacteraceae bacterium]
MFLHPTLRLVRDNTKIRFMRGRFLGILTSAVLSTASIVLFFYPGLNLGIDFRGGIVIQARTPGPADFAALRAAFAKAGLADAGLQRVGAADHVMISLESQASDKATDAAVQRISIALNKAAPGSKILGTSAVGPTVSAQLLRKGLLAVGLSLVMILVYIWFRFEWEFAIGAVVTLLLDITKTVGFLVVTRLPFDLVMVAAILTILGYSTNDKVVVYDRVRENLRKFKSMPL